MLALVENLQREDLSPREESQALARLVRKRNWTTVQVADAIKRSRSYVSKRLRVYEDKSLRKTCAVEQVVCETLSVITRFEVRCCDALRRTLNVGSDFGS